jgi:hypothetical protein
VPLDAPRPVAATIDHVTLNLVVTFDRALQPGLSSIGNWHCWDDATGAFRRRAPNAALAIAGNTVSGVMSAGVIQAGPSRVTYFGSPLDVLSLTGTPALPFADFPLVVT